MMQPTTTIALLGCGLLGMTVAWLLVLRHRLEADRALLASFMNHGPFLAFMKDAEGRYVFENHALGEHIRRIRPGVSSCIGRTDRELFPPREEKSYVDNDRLVLAHKRPMNFDEVSVDEDGTIRHWSTIKFLRHDASGRPCVAGVSIDVSQIRRAEHDARMSEDQCGLALEAGRMGTVTMSLVDETIETSPVFAVLHGRPETHTRLTFDESLAAVHPDDRPVIKEAVKAALDNQPASRMNYRVVKPDGSIAWIEFVGQVFRDGSGKPSMVRGVGFDVTDRQAAIEDIMGRKAVLRRLIEVQENERQTLCRDLHDGMMQYAVGAKMLLESMNALTDPSSRADQTEAAVALLDRGLDEGRRVIRGVRSAVLDDFGLTAAVHDLCDQMAALGLRIDMTIVGDLDGLSAPLETTVYRVVQEALSNVRRHAGTDRAAVDIRLGPDAVSVLVSDHGCGFQVEDGRRRGFGLLGMTERVRLIGGMCTITSRPDAGSRIDVRLPLCGPEAHEP